MQIDLDNISRRLKYCRNWLLKKIFNFHPWHVSAFESRPYCADLVSYINDLVSDDTCVVEIGCGLGETLSQIKSKQKTGFDTSTEVIKAANFLNYFNNTQFHIGSFGSIYDMQIDYLIAVNFLHDFESHQVKRWFEALILNNRISHLIVDELTDKNYFCLHNWEELLPSGFKQIHCIENNYKSGRAIKIFANQMLDE